MSKIDSAIYEIHHMDELSSGNQWVNRIHPLVKLVLTLFYVALTVSFPKYDIIGVAGMIVYPIAVFILADLSFWRGLKKIWIVLPFILFIGIWNPLFDKNYILIAGTRVNVGIISMFTLMIKGFFSVLASYLLIATTSIEKLCYAFQILHLPKVIVTQFMLTYRYITLLLEEVNRMTKAYALRAPNQKGVHYKVWGSLAGQLLLRSMDRAGEVYESMLLRGYQGDYTYIRETQAVRWPDVAWLLLWLGIIVLFRAFPVMLLVGNWMGGLFS